MFQRTHKRSINSEHVHSPRQPAIRNAVEALERRVLLAYALDSNFGGDGMVDGLGGAQFAVQSDQKVVARSASNQMRRVNANGSLDTTFGSGGIVTTPFTIDEIELAGNRILVSFSDPAGDAIKVGAYNLNGTPDTTFGGGDGIAEASSVVTSNVGGAELTVGADGKIIAAESGTLEGGTLGNLMVARFNADGTLDATFAGDGIYEKDLPSDSNITTALGVQSDGKVLVAYNYFLSAHSGTVWVVDRLNANGTFDKTVDAFDESFFSGPDYSINDLDVAPDNSFVIANGAALYRYKADATGDPAFNDNGLGLRGFLNKSEGEAEDDWIAGVYPQADGKILVTGALDRNEADNGATTKAFIARVLPNGNPDSTFSGTADGIVIIDRHPYTIASDVRPDAAGRLLVGGSTPPNIMDEAVPWMVRLAESSSLQTPFQGTPFNVGDTIQAEDFDRGGQNVAYFDNDATNNGGAYRPTEGVDIEATSDSGGGFNVGWTMPGEWIEYTINMPTAGSYDIQTRIASPKTGGSFHYSLGTGQIASERQTIPNTGGFQNWTTVTTHLPHLDAGLHVLRLNLDFASAGGGMANFNWLKLVPASTADTQAPSAVPNFRSTNVTHSSATVAWDAATDNVGVTGYEIWFHPNSPTLLGPEQRSYTFNELAPNRQYTFEIRAVDAAGNRGPISTAVVNTGPLPTTSGLKAEYFNNMDFTAPVLTRTDANINFNWGAGSPAAGIDPDTFSVRWTGKVTVPTTGRYTFYTTTDDGVRLWVNNQLIIDKMVPQAATEWSGSIDLVAGQQYDIRMDYFERAGGAKAELRWSGPGIAKQIVPPSAFSGSSGDTQAPSAVPNFRVFRTTDTEVTLAWEPASDNVGVAGYQIGMDNTRSETLGPAAQTYTFFNVPVGTHTFTLYAFDAAGNRGPTSTVQATTGNTGTGNGLSGEYFNNMDFTAPVFTRTDSTINFNWGTGSPDPRIASDTFSVRWSGQIQAPTTGRYTFYTTSDDGVRLWVNNQLIIDKLNPQAATEWSGSIDLVAGLKYSIQLNYFERAGGAQAKLQWSGPGVTKQVVPQANLFS